LKHAHCGTVSSTEDSPLSVFSTADEYLFKDEYVLCECSTSRLCGFVDGSGWSVRCRAGL